MRHGWSSSVCVSSSARLSQGSWRFRCQVLPGLHHYVLFLRVPQNCLLSNTQVASQSPLIASQGVRSMLGVSQGECRSQYVPQSRNDLGWLKIHIVYWWIIAYWWVTVYLKVIAYWWVTVYWWLTSHCVLMSHCILMTHSVLITQYTIYEQVPNPQLTVYKSVSPAVAFCLKQCGRHDPTGILWIFLLVTASLERADIIMNFLGVEFK